jgi:hypothetical protein
MALSDDLARLSVRAKEAEDRAAKAQKQARDQLAQNVEQARQSTQTTVDKLQSQSAAAADQAKSWGEDTQRSWDDHVAQVRQRIDARKARHQAKVAERDAVDAANYAEFTIDVAYSAIEEAEYAVLDAALYRLEADTAAGGVSS